MKTCSCNWIEEGNNGQFFIVQCHEKIWEGSGIYCIFHDPSPKKDSRLFEQKLREKIDNKDFNFQKYCFPEDWSFSDIEFNKSTSFLQTRFLGAVSFCNVVFQRDADFRGTIFQENANFSRSTFQKADFRTAKFQKDGDLSGTIFKGRVDFRNATFQEKSFFSEAIFQDVDFRDARFQDNVYFSRAIFQGKGSFMRCVFEKCASFFEAKFQGIMFFNYARFQEVASFGLSKFEEDAYFRETMLNYASFWRAIIEGDFDFTPQQIEDLDLRNAQFRFRGHVSADLSRARFHGAFLENVAFDSQRLPREIWEDNHMTDENLSFRELEAIYRNLKQNMQRHGDYSKAGELYFKEMECRKEAMKEKRFSLDWFRSFGYSILKWTCGYGEKPFWVIRNSLFVILLGAVLFFFCGVARVGAEIQPEEDPYMIDYSLDSLNLCITTFKDFGYCVYYSVVTFTTLGYGDIHPLGWSHIFASFEAFIGAFFMALFVLVFGRKMMR